MMHARVWQKTRTRFMSHVPYTLVHFAAKRPLIYPYNIIHHIWGQSDYIIVYPCNSIIWLCMIMIILVYLIYLSIRRDNSRSRTRRPPSPPAENVPQTASYIICTYPMYIIYSYVKHKMLRCACETFPFQCACVSGVCTVCMWFA